MTHRILTLIKSLGLGRAERLLLDQAPEVDRTRFAYHVAYLLPWKGYLAPQLQAAGFPVYCLGQRELQPVDDGASASEVTGARQRHGYWAEFVRLPLLSVLDGYRGRMERTVEPLAKK